MIVLNFAHPLSSEQVAQVEAATGQSVEKVIEVDSYIDPSQHLAPQVAALADAAGLSPVEWQSSSLLINLPSLNFSAAALLAELHGRCGYFPTILRLRPLPDSLPTQFEVVEIINLQEVRDQARKRRQVSKRQGVKS